jgi:nucleotide-binding universal stress UspA family protein
MHGMSLAMATAVPPSWQNIAVFLGEEPGADVALDLARHGAQVDVERATSRGKPIAEVILSHAAAHGVDLIVIGAYSHPRWTEIIFGGVTRTLLTRMPIPVLVSR